MKKISATTFSLIIGAFLMLFSFQFSIGQSVGATSTAVKSKEAQFKKDKVYEMVFFTIAKDKQKKVMEEFLPKAKPFFKKYGKKSVAIFNVEESRSEILNSQMVEIVEWDSYKAMEKLYADKKYQKVLKLAEGAFTFHKNGWFKVAEDVTTTFHSNKIYEIGGGNLHPTDEAKAAFAEYFKVSEPIKRSYGGSYPQMLAMFQPASSNGTATYTPQMQIIAEWGSLADQAKLFSNAEFQKKAMPLLMKAFAETHFVYGKIMFW